MPGPRIEENIDCRICRGVKTAEPEVDGDIVVYECRECGSTPVFRKVADTGLTCAMGLDITADERVPPGIAAVLSGSSTVFIKNIGIRERHNDDETP